MAHWLAWKLGVINKDQAYKLQGLKLSNPKEYRRLEREWGADRKSLEQKFGKEFVEVYEKIQGKTYQLKFRTNSRTGKKFPVRILRGD